MIIINGVRYAVAEATEEHVILDSQVKRLRITGPLKAMFLGGDIDIVIPGFIVEDLLWEPSTTVVDPHAAGCRCFRCIDRYVIK